MAFGECQIKFKDKKLPTTCLVINPFRYKGKLILGYRADLYIMADKVNGLVEMCVCLWTHGLLGMESRTTRIFWYYDPIGESLLCQLL